MLPVTGKGHKVPWYEGIPVTFRVTLWRNKAVAVVLKVGLQVRDNQKERLARRLAQKAHRAIGNKVYAVDVTEPNLIAFAVPDSMQGRSFLQLADGRVTSWRNEVFIQISESMTGRALRTPQWTYVVAQADGKSQAKASTYVEHQLYDLFSDPYQLVNLAGRRETRQIAAQLRARLLTRMKEAGEEPAEILPATLYP